MSEEGKERSLQRMAQLMAKGWKMRSDYCPRCGMILFQKGDKILCPSCGEITRREIERKEELREEQVDKSIAEMIEIIDLKIKDLIMEIRGEREPERVIQLAKAVRELISLKEEISR